MVDQCHQYSPCNLSTVLYEARLFDLIFKTKLLRNTKIMPAT
jgi:hypothetical protein